MTTPTPARARAARPAPRRIRVRAVLVFTVAAALAVAGVCNVIVVRAVDGALYDPSGSVPRRTVAIVPGARVYADGTPSPVLEDRLATARDLYLRGAVRKVLVSGDHGRDGYDEVNAMQRWLVAHGVRARDVYLDHAGLRTLDTMVRAVRVFKVRDAIVCTQRFHLARSVYLAREQGIDAIGAVADRRTYLHARMDGVRETFARTVAVMDVWTHRGPRHLGPAIPVEGDASHTYDAHTRTE